MAVPSSIAAFVARKASVVAVTAVIGTGAAAGAVAAVAQGEEPSSVSVDATTSIDDKTTDQESDTEIEAEVEAGIEANESNGDDGGTEPVTCDGARNHGEYVSSRARKSDAERADRSMRDAARTDCGKPDTGAPGHAEQQVGDMPDDDRMSNDDGAEPGHGRSRGQAAEDKRQDG